MMMNLFSVFDPSTEFIGGSWNWSSVMLGLLCLPSLYWVMPSRVSWGWIKVSDILFMEFKILVGHKSMGMILMFVSLFSFIVFNNFLGLFPYIFTSTSHLVITLSLSLPLWVGLMVMGWVNHSMHMFAHLVPTGTPSILMPFMVCIETISNMIRPGTLAVRLSANMIAGHLLMTLLGETGPLMNFIMVGGLIMVQVALLTLEFAVSIIQSYVFAILGTLYTKEVVFN